jgi:C-terminal of Roc, COR, domain
MVSLSPKGDATLSAPLREHPLVISFVFIVSLSEPFGICYPIRNTDIYIAPSLLPQNQPSYHWHQTDNLILSYQYEFMPRGMITRFIVETHDLIEVPDAATPQNQLVWKNGVMQLRKMQSNPNPTCL